MTEVLEYEYDIVSKKVKTLTFGNFTRDVQTKFNNIKTTIEQLNQNLSKQNVTIKEQTNLINSLNKNGYVYIDDNEILILDKIPKNQAKNIWRFGLGGIGFSSNGYEGPFETAITMNGQINAKFITTGTMSVDRIEGLANKINDYDKQLTEIELNADSIKQTVQNNSTNINNNYQEIINKLGNKAQKDDVISLENKVETIQNDTEYAIKVSEDIQTNGVSKVKTETGYTFDDDGLKIEKTNAKTKSKLNEAGLEINDATGSNEESLLFAGYDDKTGETIVKSKNMNVEKYLTIGKYSRIEDYEEGTGIFWIGGNN
uniref:Tail protein n=1 Tax=Siphoviridae sp. ct5wd11 TaxID=2827781 RepID=A0A8S5SRB5_9CAUD|nr:MAG TPA: tail protein [Siphoviridae sp. ct5wd11]